MIDRYQMERELARGAMGVVWLAHDIRLERRVAIKLLHAHAPESDTSRRMFKREAQAVARLQHPNVVEIYDYGVTDDGHPYMVMELLEGEPLAERLERARCMTPAALLPLLAQMAKALDAAHALGIAHRDLKPHNIFLCRHGADTVVKVLDFGVAVMQSEIPLSETLRGSSDAIAGTPPYMSPEQLAGDTFAGDTLAGDTIDSHRSDDLRRADLWALAVIAYQALTGQLPFVADHFSALVLRICTQPVAPPSSRVAGLTPAIDAFFARALNKDPRERYASAGALAQAFAEALPRAVTTTAIKILVVDDEPDLSLLLEQCFDDQIEDGRFQFVFAGDGKAGLDALREHPDVAVVLTDLRMPVMDGLSFLGELGAVAPTARAIVMSAFGDMGNIRKAMNRGAFDFLTKPIDFDSLEVTIDKATHEVMRLRRALQSMEENAALRMFVDPAVLDRLLPVLEVAGEVLGEAQDASVVVVRATQAPDEPGARVVVERVNRTYDALMPVFDDHGGHVIRFLGDTLLAVFQGEGHGAAARMACLSACARATPLPCALGLDEGLVIVGNVGAPSRHRFDYAVFGTPVEQAHQLARLANPGEILITGLLAESLARQPTSDPTSGPFSYQPADRPGLVIAGQQVPVFTLSERGESESAARSAARVSTEILDGSDWSFGTG